MCAPKADCQDGLLCAALPLPLRCFLKPWLAHGVVRCACLLPMLCFRRSLIAVPRDCRLFHAHPLHACFQCGCVRVAPLHAHESQAQGGCPTVHHHHNTAQAGHLYTRAGTLGIDGAAMGNGSQAGALAGGIAVDVQGEVVGYQVCLCVRAGVWGGKGAGRSGERQCELGGRVPCPQMLAHGVAIAPHCR